MANYFTYDSTGTLTAFAYNTSAITAPTFTQSTPATTTPATPSTTTPMNTGSQVAVIPFGVAWHSTYTSGNLLTLSYATINVSNNGIGLHAATFKASTVTTITQIEMSEQGPCSGNHQVTLRVNGATPGTTVAMGIGTSGATFIQPVNLVLQPGDVLTGFTAVGANGNTQCSVFLTANVASS